MKRRPRNRRRQATIKLNFERLEPRQMLAGDFVGPHQVGGTLPDGANVVVNGDFETVREGKEKDNFYSQEEVAGWNAMDAATGQEINIFHYNVSGFDNVLDLDSTRTAFDRVYQDVRTKADTEYLIAFDYRNHPTTDPNATEFSHDFQVWWNGNLVGRFTGGDRWNTGVIKVTGSNVDVTRLLFCEIEETSSSGTANAGDGVGPLLDNIRVIEANQVTIANGGFENTREKKSQFFNSDEVEVWASGAPDVNDRLLKIVADGIPTDGSQFLDLDSSATSRDIVYRDLATTAGHSYYVLFDMRTVNSSDELRVRWNVQWAATIFGTSEWETYGLVVTADSDLTQFMFLEPGETTGDGSGPLIDNVRVFHVVGPDLAIDLNGDDAGTNGTAVFVPGAGAQPIVQDISLQHATGTELTSVVVTLGGVVDNANEIISINNSTIPTDSGGAAKIANLGYNSATRQLTLTGAATVEEYQNVLRSLTYFNAANSVSTTNRTVTVAISDNTLPVQKSTAEAVIDLSVETDQATIDDAILKKFIADNNLVAPNGGNGLYVVTDSLGSGLHPTINSTVRVKYTGKFIELNSQNELVEGAVFNASPDSGAVFRLANVIGGWKQGIPLFKTSGIGKLLIPSALAYGTIGSTDQFGIPDGVIGPNTVLVFDIQLLEILI